MVYGILTGKECLRMLQIKNVLNCSHNASQYIRIALQCKAFSLYPVFKGVYALFLRVHTKV